MPRSSPRLPASTWPVSLLALVLSAGAWAEPPAVDAAKSAEAFFNEKALPILKKHCYECHSHASGKAKGGLVLDSRGGWATGGDSGPAVVPGKLDESPLIDAVRYDGIEMPPTGKLRQRRDRHARALGSPPARSTREPSL